eukprot:gb/GEZN01015651.1/.p1 GENE.gb/GEZN01015651.1/~~gb/GEZN01015651.1/.p1  ORF type:complete len:249 (-),score=13.95 gb/GEZN01015651.1/:75-821(-)
MQLRWVTQHLARAGACSRRQAQLLLAEGRITVNGLVQRENRKVSVGDQVTLDGKVLALDDPVLYSYVKPRGELVTRSDPHNRPTVFHSIKCLYPGLPDLISVGRLDFDSEGLLLLTNSGQLARMLELPTTALARQYMVLARGQPLSHAQQKQLRNGVQLDGVRYGPIEVLARPDLAGNGPSFHWYQVEIKEGKKREIRRVFYSLGQTIETLKRIGYGPYSLRESAVPRTLHLEDVQKLFGTDSDLEDR